jgi:hypothetical protein
MPSIRIEPCLLRRQIILTLTFLSLTLFSFAQANFTIQTSPSPMAAQR